MSEKLRPWRAGLLASSKERQAVGDIERLIRWYFAPDDALMAVWVAWKRSGLDPLAYHRDGTAGVGLFGLTAEDAGLGPGDETFLVNPIRNVAAAHRLYCRHGWEWFKVPPPPRAFEEPDDSMP